MLGLGFPKKLISLYIPNREKEGYGVNENGVNFLASEGAKVFITIDCGISNVKEIELAKKLGVELRGNRLYISPEMGEGYFYACPLPNGLSILISENSFNSRSLERFRRS